MRNMKKGDTKMERVTIDKVLANGGKVISRTENTVTIGTPNGTVAMGGESLPQGIVRKFNAKTGELISAYTSTIWVKGFEYWC